MYYEIVNKKLILLNKKQILKPKKTSIARLEDVARALKISISTVSRSLANSPRVKLETRIKVQEKAKELGYIPNQIAKSLISGKTKVIGVIIPRYDEPFFIDVCRGIDHYARKYNYRILISSSRNSYAYEKQNIFAFERGIVDGVIISLTHETETQEHLQEITNRGIPLVIFDNIIEKIKGAAHVRIDDFKAAFTAVSFLAKDNKLTKIGFIGGTNKKKIFNIRYEGYVDALHKHGLKYHEEYVLNCKSLHQKHEYHEIYNFISKLKEIPQAFFCTTDNYAMLCIKVLSKLGYKVPDDVQVIGFGNLHYSYMFDVELSSISQPSFSMGEKAAELLLSKINNGYYFPTNQSCNEIIMPTKLVLRSTTK